MTSELNTNKNVEYSRTYLKEQGISEGETAEMIRFANEETPPIKHAKIAWRTLSWNYT